MGPRSPSSWEYRNYCSRRSGLGGQRLGDAGGVRAGVAAFTHAVASGGAVGAMLSRQTEAWVGELGVVAAL